jgi:hypothetical protein
VVSAPLNALSASKMFERALQALPQQDRDTIMDGMAERHIYLMERQKGLDVLTPAEKDELATAMAVREIPLLRELGVKAPDTVPQHLMDKMRDQVMGTITNDIVSHNQDLCMPIIQPHMSKEVRKEIQVTTIPMFTSGIIERVRARFQPTL